jgi:hypothetical protein
LLAPFESDGVGYYLTGSMASNYWGVPRSTHDLDFVVKLLKAAMPGTVQEFSRKLYIEEATVWALYQPPHQFNAIDTRSALKVDFWLARPEPFDQEMLRRRARVTLFGEPAWISTAEDVILHKLVWNCISSSDRLRSCCFSLNCIGPVVLCSAQLGDQFESPFSAIARQLNY